MSIHPFTSESYSEDDRLVAWQEVLSGVGLRFEPLPGAPQGHATSLQRSAEGVVVARLVAGPQLLFPCRSSADRPTLIVPLSDGCTINTSLARQVVPSRHAIILPRQSDWRLAFQWDMRVVTLGVTGEGAHGRRTAVCGFTEPLIVPPKGLAGILSGTLERAAETLDELSESAWSTVSHSLSELLTSLVHQLGASRDAGATTTQAALLHRIFQTIERRLDDHSLSPARVAQIEGISERYLQKLFEGAGDSFTHYVRERRLQRSWADLCNPSEAHYPVSEIAFRYGFNDAAHFSRTFRERFGLSPRAFRQQEAERAAMAAKVQSQRGWPKGSSVKSGQQPLPIARVQLPPERVLPKATSKRDNHYLAVDASRVHWGYFSRSLAPLLEIGSGDYVTIETLTQHASDDPQRMIEGDAGAESVFRWTASEKAVNRRGAGPMDASVFGRGAGEGFGVHICTGPISVRDAQPGDVLEVRILDIAPRPSRNPSFEGRMFGSSVAAWWGYHYGEFLSPRPREVVTIYEIFPAAQEPYAKALYSYLWEPQTDPSGVVHPTYDYPGVPVANSSITHRHEFLHNVRIPLRPHFGVIGVAPREADLVDSVPPSYFGGNIDNWRLGKGAAVYLPVSVPGGLLSIGDPHAAQGDGELSGTAIECSMTGTFQVILHKKADLNAQPYADLTYPLIETETHWIMTGFSHPNYLAEFGSSGQSEVYAKSSLDLAMKDAFRKARRFLMNSRGLSEDEAVALMSAAVDFGVTQVVDGNWGVHALISKRLFTSDTRN
ncbi:MAG TPA: acetamidase/formamidase family protein [Bradyrhizobium sp.]|nr:acetamidase/formamidase family protein [Bradyrhizobium sp.]